MGTLRGEVAAALREAPFDSSFWPRALEATARACGAASAQLLSFGQCRFAPIVAPGFTPDEIANFVALEGADPAVNHGLRAVLSTPLHAIVTDAEYLSDGQRDRDRLYNEFFRRFDGHHVASGTVARSDTAFCNLNLFLPERSGGLGAGARRTLRGLLPMFTQALRLSARLEETATALACEAWDAGGDAVMICSANGTILHASREAERLLARQGRKGHPGNGLAGLIPSIEAQFRVALHAALDPLEPVSSHVAARSARGEALSLEVVPLPPSWARLSPSVLVLLEEADKPITLDHDRLAVAFRLTRAECEVADGLMRRLSSAEIARQRGVSIETVNTQVKSLLAKTGTADRGKLTLLLQAYIRRHRIEDAGGFRRP